MSNRLFPALLRCWRNRRGPSQLDLALEGDVSPRHVSFLESGRAPCMSLKCLLVVYAALLLSGCGRESKRVPPHASGSASATTPASEFAPAVKARPPEGPSPTRLTSLGMSAYATSLGLDDDAVYLMTPNAAFRLVDGEPAHGIRLELGIGPALTRTAFIYWSKGAIWSTPKQGGATRELAKFAHQPQYFVASGDALAWVDQTTEGLYTIQTLDGRKPRVLVSSTEELRALDMIGDAVYFVHRPARDAWRVGVVRVTGPDAQYGVTHQGRAPAQLAGSDAIYYYDLDKKRILELSLDLRREVPVKDLVCSPIHVSSRIYCGCVEGLFEISKAAHKPSVLAANRPGAIAKVISNSKLVAWTVDLGSDQLAVDMLPAPGLDDPPK